MFNLNLAFSQFDSWRTIQAQKKKPRHTVGGTLLNENDLHSKTVNSKVQPVNPHLFSESFQRTESDCYSEFSFRTDKKRNKCRSPLKTTVARNAGYSRSRSKSQSRTDVKGRVDSKEEKELSSLRRNIFVDYEDDEMMKLVDNQQPNSSTAYRGNEYRSKAKQNSHYFN